MTAWPEPVYKTLASADPVQQRAPCRGIQQMLVLCIPISKPYIFQNYGEWKWKKKVIAFFLK